MQKTLVLTLLILPLATASCTTRGADYEDLVAQNYKTSTLMKNKAGLPGWEVTNGENTYFCRMAATMAVGDNDTYNPFDNPKLSDLEAGRPRPKDAKRCLQM